MFGITCQASTHFPAPVNTMNFFEQQDLAHRKTRQLVLLLVLAVISLIVITVLLLAVVFAYFQGSPSTPPGNAQQLSLGKNLLDAMSWQLWAGTSVIVCFVVSCGSFYKLIQLRSGGQAVAEAMGGRLLNMQTRDADEKKILNVVEEMAIASGTPVPLVYVIDDSAINAFAAGHSPQNAVIGITRGCIQLLSRDELQGVIAHEFSHIFHGDMRINIRLVAVLHGILLLGLIGGYLVRTTHHRNIIRSDRDKSPGAILGLGIGLMIIGYAGTFFGNLIKAAVSRQREFLADASAVKFTRNPDGIAGALKKIGGHVKGSQLDAETAAEFSHMYFSQGVRTAFNSLMATHPPLEDRIKRIEPRWDGKFAQVSATTANTRQQNDFRHQEDYGSSHFNAPTQNSIQAPIEYTTSSASASINSAISQIGQPSTAHLAYAQQKLAAIDTKLRTAAHDPLNARALIFGLLLDNNPSLREKPWQLLASEFTVHELAALKSLADQTAELDASLRLPLTELALPSLKQLASDQYSAFKRGIDILIEADKKVSLMEWALRRIVLHHLEPFSSVTHYCDLRERRNECQLLLSVLAYSGTKSKSEAQAAFNAAIIPLRFATLAILPTEDCSMSRLDTALSQLNQVKPLQKPTLLKAMGKCVAHDNKITVTEAELFRAMADGLNCPMPPLTTEEQN